MKVIDGSPIFIFYFCGSRQWQDFSTAVRSSSYCEPSVRFDLVAKIYVLLQMER